MADLRQVDFLPSRFDGKTICHELATAHFLSFMDYLQAHELHNPAGPVQLANVITLFKRTLKEKARTWIEGKNFATLEALKAAFVARFSPAHSDFANVKLFNNMKYTPGESAEQHLARFAWQPIVSVMARSKSATSFSLAYQRNVMRQLS